MLEYSTVLGGDLRDVWMGQLLPLLDSILSSPYFWPGVAVVAAIFLLLVRLISK